uniref:Uncharacterized protein n=1 Tax=Vespula pensylvanica TaxID=30213 RepID=A0A834P384_VESPE|nr:hypothetical protein H0235_008325 [Vespula pensylvanica]
MTGYRRFKLVLEWIYKLAVNLLSRITPRYFIVSFCGNVTLFSLILGHVFLHKPSRCYCKFLVANMRSSWDASIAVLYAANITVVAFVDIGISAVYIKYSMGPRTLLCSTPECMGYAGVVMP